MLRTAVRLQRSLTALSTFLVNENDSAENALTEIDWEVAKSTLSLLEPFNQGFLILFLQILLSLNITNLYNN